MSRRRHIEQVPAGPFLAWLRERREHHERTSRDGAPVLALVGDRLAGRQR